MTGAKHHVIQIWTTLGLLGPTCLSEALLDPIKPDEQTRTCHCGSEAVLQSDIWTAKQLPLMSVFDVFLYIYTSTS